jgi:hypothetical protein
MVSLTYFEAVLLFIIMCLFIYIALRMRPVIFVKDENFYSELRKKAMESITEDIRQSIYDEEYENVLSDLKDQAQNNKNNHHSQDQSENVKNFPDNTSEMIQGIKEQL